MLFLQINSSQYAGVCLAGPSGRRCCPVRADPALKARFAAAGGG